MTEQKVRTLCKGCGFATYEGDTLERGEPVQVGCAVNRIEEFKRAGVEVEELEDNTFRVHSHCNKARHPLWIEKYGEESIEKVEEEVRPPVDIIIPITSRVTLDEIETTVKSLANQNQKWNKVVLALFNRKIKPSSILKICDPLFSFVNYVLNDYKQDSDEILDIVNKSVNKCDGLFYVIVKPGQTVNENLLDILHEVINHRMMKLVLIHGELDYPILIHRLVHIKMGGHTLESLDGEDLVVYTVPQKIEEKLSNDEQKKLVSRWSELWNYLK